MKQAWNRGVDVLKDNHVQDDLEMEKDRIACTWRACKLLSCETCATAKAMLFSDCWAIVGLFLYHSVVEICQGAEIR